MSYALTCVLQILKAFEVRGARENPWESSGLSARARKTRAASVADRGKKPSRKRYDWRNRIHSHLNAPTKGCDTRGHLITCLRLPWGRGPGDCRILSMLNVYVTKQHAMIHKGLRQAFRSPGPVPLPFSR